MTAISTANFTPLDATREPLLREHAQAVFQDRLLTPGSRSAEDRGEETERPGALLRTGAIDPPPAVLRLRPSRDVFGRVIQPARVWLHAEGTLAVEGEKAIQLPRKWLSKLVVGDVIAFSDARESRRRMRITDVDETGCWAALVKTAYLVPGVTLNLKKRHGRKRSARIMDVTRKASQRIKLREGDTLILTRDADSGRPALMNASGEIRAPATIGCTSPGIFETLTAGDPIGFGEGKIGGIVDAVEADALHVRITYAPGGAKLKSDTLIDLPYRYASLARGRLSN